MRTLWLVAALLLIPSALAVHGDLVATSSLPIQMAADTTQVDDGHLLLQGDDGTMSLQFYGESGTATRVIYRAFGYVRQDDPQAGVLWHQRVREIPLDLEDATITLSERLPEFTLLAAGDYQRQTNQATLGILNSPLPVQISSSGDWSVALQMGTTPEEHVRTLDAGLYQALSGQSVVRATNVTGTLGGALLQYSSPDHQQIIQANFRVEQAPGTIYNPMDDTWIGAGTHDEYILEYLRLDGTGTLHLSHSGISSSLFSTAGHFDILGQTILPAATGTLQMEHDSDDIHTFTNQDLTLDGHYDLVVRDGNPATVHGHGDFTKVSYGDVEAKYDWANVAAAVGIGAALLAALAWVGVQAKGALGVAGYARVQGEEILNHPGRQTVYDLVKANPGNNFQELESRVAFGSSTLNYHLRVLEKNEYVTRVKDGRYVRFFDRQNGGYSAGRKTALSTLQNRTTAAIAQHIIQYPGTPQCDLAQRFGIAASTVSWHIRRLSEAGLVDRARDQHYTRYYMGEAWSTLPSQELARFGVA